MKFTREKISSFLGPYSWVYTESSTEGSPVPFIIVINKSGVFIEGDSPAMTTEQDLEVFAKAISDAWHEYQTLKNKKTILDKPYGS